RYGSQQLSPQMYAPLKGIDEAPGQGVVPQGVDGEIAPGQVQFQAVREDDVVGPPLVAVGSVAAHGGHFQASACHKDGYRTKPLAGGEGSWKELFHLVRYGVGGNVPIRGLKAQQAVANGPTHQV